MGNVLSRPDPGVQKTSLSEEDEINALYAQAATLIEKAESKTHRRDVKEAHENGREPPPEACKVCDIKVLFCMSCGRKVYCHRGWCSRVENRHEYVADAGCYARGVEHAAHSGETDALSRSQGIVNGQGVWNTVPNTRAVRENDG